MDNSVKNRLKQYVSSHMFGVKGYLHPADACCYSSILEYQDQAGFRGGVAEIGVYFGRSFFLLANSLQPGEKAFAADLFDIGPKVGGETSQLREFREAAARLGLPISDDCLCIGPSEDLQARRVLDAVGRVRFFSIDGGHMLHNVKADAALAQSVLADHGVLAFDDFCNPEWPEVSLGVFDFLRTMGDACVPFAITKAKLYTCSSAFHDRYFNSMDSGWVKSFVRKEISLLGSKLWWFHHNVKDRMIFEGLSRIGLKRTAAARLRL